jgi:polyhydroxybutyrate depolymerase
MPFSFRRRVRDEAPELTFNKYNSIFVFMKFFRILFFNGVFIVISITTFAQSIKGKIMVNDTVRTYSLFIPQHLDSSKNYPLVIALHGGGGIGANMERFTHFDDVAQKEKFLVCYPNGYNKGWNDHRAGSKIPSRADDVKFISMLIDELVNKYHADPKRVFVTGMSNGAIMSLFLAQELSNKIRAVAAVCGSIPENYASTYHISNPVSVMVMNGTDDKLVNYYGGPVLFEYADRGAVIPTDTMIQKLLVQLKCHGQPDVYDFPDIDPHDQCNAIKYTFKSCAGNSEVVFIMVIGGGHTWPGGPQYTTRLIIGNVCRDFYATEEIWNFFKQQVY